MNALVRRVVGIGGIGLLSLGALLWWHFGAAVFVAGLGGWLC